jgi:multimeric flavodoxin WrbA
MRVLGISGSPRRGGSAETLLDKALEGAASQGAMTEKIVLSELRISPCHECGGCRRTGICVIKDDMQAVYGKIASCDGLIVACPIFFGSVTAQLKAMIDRFQCAWIAKYLLKQDTFARAAKVEGAFLCVGGWERTSFFENAKSLIKNFFATVNVEYSRELFRGGVSGKEDILKDAKALEEAYDIGREIC